jgi:hypothetical protein
LQDEKSLTVLAGYALTTKWVAPAKTPALAEKYITGSLTNAVLVSRKADHGIDAAHADVGVVRGRRVLVVKDTDERCLALPFPKRS